jgi:hypothetical protein
MIKLQEIVTFVSYSKSLQRRRHTAGQGQVISSTRDDWLTCRDEIWRVTLARLVFVIVGRKADVLAVFLTPSS